MGIMHCFKKIYVVFSQSMQKFFKKTNALLATHRREEGSASVLEIAKMLSRYGADVKKQHLPHLPNNENFDLQKHKSLIRNWIMI
jgi:hypothetical protein